MATNINSRKYAKYRSSYKEFNRNFYNVINRELLDFAHKKSKKIAEKFVELAVNNLEDATPAPESKHFVDDIRNGIKAKRVYNTYTRGETVFKKYKGYNVVFPVGKNGLTMFLEYGTGLAGLREPHEETSRYAELYPWTIGKEFDVGWEYAKNRNKYKTVFLKNNRNQRVKVTQPCYIVKDGKRGFVFKKTNDSYVEKLDVEFHNQYSTKYSWVKGYTDKNGRVVKPYVRYHKDLRTYTSRNTYVLSTGITPVRFIYRAKKEILRMIKSGEI